MNTDRFRFRAFVDGQWIEPCLDENGTWYYSGFRGGFWDDAIFIPPEKIVQCTGLKDKNGVLIYEGDVVEYKFSSLAENFIQVVEYSIRTMESSDVDWTNVGFVLKGKENDGSDWFSTFTPHARYKVIGNIYQNEDLLNDS